ncbi:MAG: glycosyltransferase family 2 protein [Pararhodobacter sp.]
MDNTKATVGIVIRTRDRPLFVRRALASVLAQGWPHWQIALINDGGEARALEAALAEVPGASDEARLHVEHLAQSIGRSAAFNRGLELLDTDFIACLDDDDTWSPDFLQSLIEFHARIAPLVPDLGGVMCRLTAIREDIVEAEGTTTLTILGEDELPNAFARNDFFINPIAYACYRQDMFPVQWLLRREAALAAGGFPVAFNVMEDRAFMTRFLQHWRLAVLDRKLAYHHRRIRRQQDRSQSVDLNTMDNPSYDWRLYSDLARLTVHSPTGATPQETDAGALLRGVAATLLREINDETSALWHKLDGEAEQLGRRLEQLENRLVGTTPPEDSAIAPAGRIYALWERIGPHDLGHAVAPGHPFAERFELSQGFDIAGRLVHASHAARQFIVQLPQTRDWSAIEFSLDGLVEPGTGLRCEVLITSERGYLFETALSCWQPGRRGQAEHRFVETHVHSCPANGSVRVTRDFAAALLSGTGKPRLSIILPRHAVDFRFCCRDLRISRL